MEKTIKSEIIYKGKIITVLKDDVSLEKKDGLEVNAIREVVLHNGGACALVRTKDNKIMFVKQYRYTIKDYLYELPAGKIDSNENPNVTIVRELEEEVGIKATKVESLGRIVLSPGFSNEYIYLYYVDEYEKSNVNFDEDEELEYFEFTIDEVLEMIKNGVIYDAKSVALIMMLKDRFL